MAKRRTKIASSGCYLLDCARALPPEGAHGFEGLIRLLVEEWTGRQFRLARGGEQYGHDEKSEPGELAPTILVECKRYDDDNKPPSRELMGELAQAVSRFPSLDLWVLVATTEIGSNAREELCTLAAEHALEVLVVDTRPDGTGSFHLLCAAYPHVTSAFLVAKAGADAQRLTVRLDAIRSLPDFSSRTGTLRESLCGLMLGYEDAARRMGEWLCRNVKERAAARAAFGQDLALHEGDVHLIPRQSISDALGQWWRVTPDHPPFSLLGEEGSGKSWAAMSWVIDLVASDDRPLVIPVTSNMVQGPERPAPARILAEVLARCIGRSESWWLRRTSLWWKGHQTPSRPLVLFLLDGLNEAPDLSWRQFIGQAQIQENRRHCAVLLTCRKPYWDEHLSHLPEPYVTRGYSADELREAVHGRIDLTAVPDELQDLMRRPRYCDLVVRHCAEMLASGDFTIARLMFLDRLDRHRRRENYPFSPSDFDQVVRGLAQTHLKAWRSGRLEARFGKSELRSLLPKDSSEALSDLITNGVLEPTHDPAYPYRVEKQRLVYGLGMLLASELSQIAGNPADAVEEWFEPQRDMDIKTEIIGAALFFTLPTQFPQYPSSARQALLRAWLVSRNMPPEQEAAIVAYLPDCAEDMLAISDNFFTISEQPTGNAQGRLGKALVARRTDGRVLPSLIAAANRWAGYVRDSRPSSSMKLAPSTFGPFEKVPFEDQRGAALHHFLSAIVQAGPRFPFIPAFIRAALSAGFIQGRFVDSRFDWSLRLTDEGVGEIIAPLLPDIASSGGAGHLLLRQVLGLPRLPSCQKPGAEEKTPDGVLDRRTAILALNPNVSITDKWMEDADYHLSHLTARHIIFDQIHTDTDSDFKWLEPVLAAQPHSWNLGDFLRNVGANVPLIGEAEGETDGCRLLTLTAVADEKAVNGLKWWQRYVAAKEKQDLRALGAEAYAFLALAMALPPRETIDQFLTRPSQSWDLWPLQHWFSRQSVEIAVEIHARILEESQPRRLSRLLFAASCACRPLTPAQRQVIADCLKSDDESLRHNASLYTLASRDEELIAEIAQSDRSLSEPKDSAANEVQAHTLAHHGQSLPFSALIRRLPVPHLASAVMERGMDPAETTALAKSIESVLASWSSDIPNAPPDESPWLRRSARTPWRGRKKHPALHWRLWDQP